ncbi:hypothetical protein [Tabrizicola sp. YIM 78059]|uniref:hypothetical protein n=1 Tax=Tabrizicola sp. YIM 78059 TaxID=2529861 RepID=UPI00145B1E6F|nr:hypothetical protein [Tabrizicola sp. YIM 78059]
MTARIAWQAVHDRKQKPKTGPVEHLLAFVRVMDMPRRHEAALSVRPIRMQVRPVTIGG